MTIADPEVATTDFEAVQTCSAPPDRVRAALTSPEAVAGWWGETAGSLAVGGRFAVGFGSDRVITMEVAAAGPDGVAWLVEEAPFTPEWAGTTILFEIVGRGTGSEVRFRHHGLTPQFDCYEMCQAGWTHYLASLVAFVDQGAGDPYRGD